MGNTHKNWQRSDIVVPEIYSLTDKTDKQTDTITTILRFLVRGGVITILNSVFIVNFPVIVVVVIPTKAFARDYGITGVRLSVCLFVCLFVCYHDN